MLPRRCKTIRKTHAKRIVPPFLFFGLAFFLTLAYARLIVSMIKAQSRKVTTQRSRATLSAVAQNLVFRKFTQRSPVTQCAAGLLCCCIGVALPFSVMLCYVPLCSNQAKCTCFPRRSTDAPQHSERQRFSCHLAFLYFLFTAPLCGKKTKRQRQKIRFTCFTKSRVNTRVPRP